MEVGRAGQKVAALAAEYEHDEDVAKKHIAQAERLARIRNRLMHYKEPAMGVDASVLQKDATGLRTTGDVLKAINDSLPDPDIVHAVRSLSHGAETGSS